MVFNGYYCSIIAGLLFKIKYYYFYSGINKNKIENNNTLFGKGIRCQPSWHTVPTYTCCRYKCAWLGYACMHGTAGMWVVKIQDISLTKLIKKKPKDQSSVVQMHASWLPFVARREI